MAQHLEASSSCALRTLDGPSFECAVPIGSCLVQLASGGGVVWRPDGGCLACRFSERVLLNCSDTIGLALARCVGHYRYLSRTERVGFFLFDNGERGVQLKAWIRAASVFGGLVGSDALAGLRDVIEESMRDGWLPKRKDSLK